MQQSTLTPTTGDRWRRWIGPRREPPASMVIDLRARRVEREAKRPPSRPDTTPPTRPAA